jgi:hypothetical protein
VPSELVGDALQNTPGPVIIEVSHEDRSSNGGCMND